MLRDKIIVKELKRQGIRASDYYGYILRNPDIYDKLDGQADISLKVAISAYSKILKRGGKRV